MVKALDRIASASPWSEQALAPYFSPSPGETHFALVMEQAGDCVGFLLFTRLLDEASIDNLAIAPGHQGKGLGKTLLIAGLEEMAAVGLYRCLLDVRESNVAARALYENNGFVVDGIRPRYYNTERGREDALLMSRRL